MAQFRYEGRDRTGKKRSGTIAGMTRREALIKLKDKGIFVTHIQEVPESLLQKEITLGSPVKFQDFVLFLRQFSTLLQAGITIAEATNILAGQTDSKPLKRVLETIEEDIRSGQPLSQAAAKHEKIFPPFFINMVHAGEVSGNLDGAFDQLAIYFEKQYRTRQKVGSALAYPVVVGFVTVGVVIFLLMTVVPAFANLFASFGAELPAITKFVLAASDWITDYWWFVTMLGILAVLLLLFFKHYGGTRYYYDYLMLKIPIFGKLIQKSILARLTRTFSSLFASAVPILQAMSMAEKIAENEVVSRVLQASREALEKGESLTGPMSRHWFFPPMVIHMLAIGERTGSLDQMMGKVADFYEAEVESMTDRLKSLIEPFLIVFLAGIVGTIVTSIAVPMFEIFRRVG